MAQTITLREITPENEAAVRALRVAPGQEQFVDSVAASLDEAERSPDAPNYPLCIMSMMELSPATYIAFGRLTVAFGRLEGHVNWIMSLLLIQHEARGTPQTRGEWGNVARSPRVGTRISAPSLRR